MSRWFLIFLDLAATSVQLVIAIDTFFTMIPSLQCFVDSNGDGDGDMGIDAYLITIVTRASTSLFFEQEQSTRIQGGPLMADCLLHNLKRGNRTSIFSGCGHFDVYSEINGPRRLKYHPKFHDRKGYLLDDGTYDFDGPGQRIFFPQRFRIREIHDSYPNATWILNWRDYDPWIDSVLKWGTGDNLHYQFLNEYYIQGVIPSVPPPENRTQIKEVLKTIYFQHFDFVRDFVRNHPSHALVEVNITDQSASMVLADAFGLDALAWKNLNKNRRNTKKLDAP